MNQDNVVPLPETFTCPACGADISHKTDFQNKGRPFKKGDIILCSKCGSVLKVGDSKLLKMSKEELDKLDKRSKSMIAVLAASIVHSIVVKQGGKPELN
jgi:transcription elongation factor Elf1